MILERAKRDMLLLAPCVGNEAWDQARAVCIRAALSPLSADMTRQVYGETRVVRAMMRYDGSLVLAAGSRVRVDPGSAQESTYLITQVDRYPLYQRALLVTEEAALC